MRKINKNNEGQLLLMTGIILTFALIAMASISASITDIGLQTSSEQTQQLLVEFDDINSTFWKAYEVELYATIKGSSKIIETTTIGTLFNKTVTRIKDIEGLRGIRFAATIDNITIETSKEYIAIYGGGGIPQGVSTYGIIDTDDGTISNWTTVYNLPPHGLYQSAIAANQTVFYLIGGRDNVTIYRDVYYSKQSLVGSLTTWAPTTPLPSPRAGLAAVMDRTNGRIYVLGGFYGMSPCSTVYYANISANDTIENWTQTLNLSAPLYKHSAVMYNNRIYVIGGEGGSRAVSTVYSGEIVANGTINDWTTEFPIPSPRTAHSAAITIVEGVPYIYITGGIDSGGTPTKTVYYASINVSNGSLNRWLTSSTTLPEPIYSHGSTIENNRLYLIGGRYTNTMTSNKVLFANISTGGTLDVTWNYVASLPNAPAELSCWSSKEVVYIAGGRDNSYVVSTLIYEYYAGSKINCKFILNGERSEKSTIRQTVAYSSSAI